MADKKVNELKVVGTVNLYSDLTDGYARYDTDKRDKGKEATCKVVITFPVPEKGTAEEIESFMVSHYGFGLQTALKKAVVQQLYGDNGTEVKDGIDTSAETKRLETWLQSPRARVAGPTKIKKAEKAGYDAAFADMAKQAGFGDDIEAFKAAVITMQKKKSK